MVVEREPVESTHAEFVKPLMLPDELGGVSHLGRFKAINGFRTNNKITLRALARWIEVPSGYRRCPLAHLLAAASGMETLDYVQHHSMHYLSTGIHARDRHSEKFIHQALRLLRSSAYLCVDCAYDDRQRYGISYWHRDHQLPGAFWCNKHSCLLRFVEKDALQERPITAIRRSLPLDRRIFFSMKGSEIVERFMKIQRVLLSRREPLAGLAVSKVLQDAADKEGLRDWRGLKYTPFSDFISARFNHYWLESVIPAFEFKQMGQLIKSVDSAIVRGYGSVAIYTIALAAFYETSSSEIDLLLGSPSGFAKSPKVAVSIGDLCSAYREADGVHAEVAKTLNIMPSVARLRLEQVGLPSMFGRPREQISVALSRFVGEGSSLEEACEGLDLEQAELEAILRATAKNVYLATRPKRRRSESAPKHGPADNASQNTRPVAEAPSAPCPAYASQVDGSTALTRSS